MTKKYPVSFAPLDAAGTRFLSEWTHQDFSTANFNDTDTWLCCTVSDSFGPVVVIVLEFKSPFDAHLSVACADPHAISRRLITVLYKTVFRRAARVTALIQRDNGRAIRQIWRMGFVHEGILRRGFDGKRDASVFGLLPEDCPYLRDIPFRIRHITVTHEPVMRVQ